MSESIRFSGFYPKLEARKSVAKKGRWSIFLVVGLLANATLWSAALIYLKVAKPTYSSTLALNLPGTVSDTNVNLPNIGEATSQNASPYGIATQDPRQNYKYIALSTSVLKAAAKQLHMSVEKFGKPQIKLPDSTTIMNFTFKGATPEEARSKSIALYKAFQDDLSQLRTQEAVQRDLDFHSALAASEGRLEIAKKHLSDFKASSMLNSEDQIKSLSENIEQLRRQRAEAVAQQQQASGRLSQLSVNLNLSDQQASDAFTLATDQIFQQNLKDYSEASANLVVLNSKYLPDYPLVVSENARKNAAQVALLKRAQTLLGRPIDLVTLQRMSTDKANNGTGREVLLQNLVTVRSEQQGFKGQAEGLTQQIKELEARLRALAEQEGTLSALEQNVQVSEAVFSSTLAKLDIGRSNPFGSYPLIQLLTLPTLPEEPSWPKPLYVLLGAFLGSLFLNAGLLSFWWRQRQTSIHEQERYFKTLEHMHHFPSFAENGVEGYFRDKQD